jgi:hypothetical protein
MCKRILAFACLLSFIAEKNIFAEDRSAIENIKSEKEDDNDFLDSFLAEENYQVKPQVNVSFYPKYGINFLCVSDKKKSNNKDKGKRDKEDFEIFKSRNLGATLAVNIPIRYSNFFYAIAFDLCRQTLTWKNFKNLHSENLFVGKIATSGNNKSYSDILNEDFATDVESTRLNFFDFAAMLGLGFKSDIYNYKNGFFIKALLGVGFQFSDNVDIKKKDFLLSTKTINNVPLRNIKFLWSLEMGYWRFGLNIMGDFLSTLNDDYKGVDLNLSRFFSPISLTVFFDLL